MSWVSQTVDFSRPYRRLLDNTETGSSRVNFVLKLFQHWSATKKMVSQGKINDKIGFFALCHNDDRKHGNIMQYNVITTNLFAY